MVRSVLAPLLALTLCCSSLVAAQRTTYLDAEYVVLLSLSAFSLTACSLLGWAPRARSTSLTPCTLKQRFHRSRLCAN